MSGDTSGEKAEEQTGSSNGFTAVFQRCTASTFVTDIETMMRDKSYLYIKARFRYDGADILRRLGATILGRQITCDTTEDCHFIDLRYGRTWAPIGRFFFILHPDDPYSCLILENTDADLKITLQGRWQQGIGEEIAKLAAEWELANMSATKPAYEDPPNVAGSVVI